MQRPDFGCEAGAVRALFEQDKRFTLLRYEEKMGVPDFGGGTNKTFQPQKLVYCVVQKR
ncbi:hypothetical protein [Hymenobacter sp. B81]|uniref:hypothetical protein n=1 Tax=Hymenobacter sp. B81 TaxID=3344878 RepID=UPI0037DD0809